VFARGRLVPLDNESVGSLDTIAAQSDALVRPPLVRLVVFVESVFGALSRIGRPFPLARLIHP
jgi:hypothetical protein